MGGGGGLAKGFFFNEFYICKEKEIFIILGCHTCNQSDLYNKMLFYQSQLSKFKIDLNKSKLF